MLNDVFFNNPFESSPDKDLEEKQIQEIEDLTIQLLKKRYVDQNKPVLRGVHPKSHGCVNASFEVLPGIDKSLQVGMFAHPATYEAVIRYSNASTVVAPDLAGGQNGSRGMAIKVRNVEGKVLQDDSGWNSQDFLMINTPSFAFVNVGDYLRLNQILFKFDDSPAPFFAPLQAPPPTDPEKLAEFGRVAASFKVLQQIQAKPVANPLEISYFGGAPYLFGKDRCMHFSAVPQDGEKPQPVPENPSPDYLRDALQKTMAGKADIVYDFRVQVRKAGEPDLFIEDATKSWDPQQHPPQTVARVTIPAPQTGLDTPEHLQECEELVYTPWHTLAEYQPLGSINRLRYAIYRKSSEFRRR
tara:strand:+ start:3295 stop:4362 length:1068 start_codon:yes stop_codon:yes gene_type:complete